ncbi:polymorphic toxin-type HINT domain-containing protein [Streptomyces sp. CA-210063]|uniref:polymorphic toxin-type HINT domain-containing protein n=1 Tax=Streptomyces sp. CA-210063 TaxID=2801029 RepID=UPI00214B1FE0|nr:polymorphic toxin-type HINT domain-containing protein [Streptomyces sp. CA-210063]UUU35678.1 polymorphic toxin-type HINT domain-containing protein [Streptomyces sp. CA-210063]
MRVGRGHGQQLRPRHPGPHGRRLDQADREGQAGRQGGGHGPEDGEDLRPDGRGDDRGQGQHGSRPHHAEDPRRLHRQDRDHHGHRDGRTPLLVPSLREWVDAGELEPGQWVQTSSGTWVQISAVKAWTAQKATVHNLTVTDAHTYYVLAGATPVLVHNCGWSELAA